MEFPLSHRSWVDCDGNKALTFKYHKGEENKILEVINILNKNMAYNKVESHVTRDEALAQAQQLIDRGSLTTHYEKNGEVKWTAEDWIEYSKGWYPGEEFWISLSKNETYTYQVILKDGDVLYFSRAFKEPFGSSSDIEGLNPLPCSNMWKEEKGDY